MPQIFVTIANGADTGRKLTVEVESADTVKVLKEKVEKAGGPCATLQRLSHDTVEMLSQRTLRDYKIQKESELKLVVRPEHNKRADEQRSKPTPATTQGRAAEHQVLKSGRAAQGASGGGAFTLLPIPSLPSPPAPGSGIPARFDHRHVRQRTRKE